MADEDYSYEPNAAVMDAVQGSLQTGHIQGASGLGPATSVSAPRPGMDLSSLPLRYRAAATAQQQGQAITAAHNAALEGVARAHLAVDQANSFYSNAKTRNELIQQANQLNQSAGFFAEHAQLNPYSPDYYQHVNALAAKYPGATDNKTVQAILANPKLREQAALKGDVPGEVSTRNALKAGWLKAEDFNNPALRNQDGTLNHDAAATLADLREGQSVEPPHIKTARAGLAEINKMGTDLTPQQEGLKTMYSTNIYQFEQGRQAALGIKPTPKVTAASFLPRAAVATAPAAPVQAPQPAPQTSIPPAGPPPTPAPTAINPEAASKYLNQYFPGQ